MKANSLSGYEKKRKTETSFSHGPTQKENVSGPHDYEENSLIIQHFHFG